MLKIHTERILVGFPHEWNFYLVKLIDENDNTMAFGNPFSYKLHLP